MHDVLRRFLVSAAALGLAAVATSARADDAQSTTSGRASVYKNLSSSSLESVSSPEVIRSMFGKDLKPVVAPTKIWQVLEHGEKMECLSCISLVSGLLYDSNAKTREIAAWWLRRRIFGVFGPGEAYSKVVATLGDAAQSDTRRAHAASALGEFLTQAGAPYLADAIRNDTAPVVREAAVRALQRMASIGPNDEISLAMSDSDPGVRLAAVEASTRINAFDNVEAVVARIDDDSADVRRAAVLALGSMRVGDAVDGLMALVSPADESDASVRKAAIWSLGQIADPSAVETVRGALSDPDSFVRDAARVALQRM